jgi:uncharacterized membrane protein YgcG
VSGASPTLVLVLQKLGKTDGRALLKQAVKELIARGVLRVETEEPGRRRRARGPKFWLVEGSAPTPSSRALQATHRYVLDERPVLRGGRPARELKAVAKALARERAHKEILAAAILDLTAMGLVRKEQRRTLGLFRRVLTVRTPGGDALVQQEERRRAGARSTGAADAPYFPVVIDPDDPHHDPDQVERADAAWDGSVDGALDSSFDGAFDSSFDSSFDSAFDSSFDSGFSDGGGGGGSDGGGGGGDGGGGGGGD